MRILFMHKENNNIIYSSILFPELPSSSICWINYVIIVFFVHKKYSRVTYPFKALVRNFFFG